MSRRISIGLDGPADGDAAVELGLSRAKTHDALTVGVSIGDESGILVSQQALFAPGDDQSVPKLLAQVAQHRPGAFLSCHH